MDAITSLISNHPEVVVSLVGALLVHLRAAVPAGKPGSAWGLITTLWDVLAGNYGQAKNAPPVQDKQDTPVKNALDV